MSLGRDQRAAVLGCCNTARVRSGGASEPPAIRLLEVSRAAVVAGELRTLVSYVQSAAHIVGSVCQDCEYRGWDIDSNGEPQSVAGDAFHDPALLRAQRGTHNAVVLDFLCCCQDVAKWSAETNVVAAILTVRFSRTHPVNWGNWERVLLVALLLAQKLVDDSSLCKSTHRKHRVLPRPQRNATHRRTDAAILHASCLL